MPIIAEQIPKYKIDSVEFERLTLGSLPPTFQGQWSLFLQTIVMQEKFSESFKNLGLELTGYAKAE